MPSPFAASFLKGAASALEFLPGAYLDRDARRRWVQERRERRPAPGVLEALGAQTSRRNASEAVRRNLDALATPGTLTVVTGQQVGLFLGPLYSFYKAASAIAAARALEQETGARVVPVFWLQTEDHDFEEIASCEVLNPEGQNVRFSMPLGEVGDRARVSVANRRLGPEIGAEVGRLTAQLGSLPGAEAFLHWIQEHYRKGAGLSEAFAGVMGSVFAPEGLLFLDPRAPELAAPAAVVHARALAQASEVSALLQARAAALEAAGFEPQVHVRPGSPLFFYHPDGAEGPRYRLDPSAEGWTLVGSDRTVTTAALEQMLVTDPSRFSTSALLRPILQDHLLPVVAYVGGPGEINYLAQTHALSRGMDVPPSMVIPRARFRLIEPRTRSLLETLGLSAADVELPRDALLQKVIPAEDTSALSPLALEAQLQRALEAALGGFDAEASRLHLERALNRTRATLARAASRFSGRYRAALAQQDQVRSERVDRLRARLFPENMPQERFHSLPYFACRYGVETLKARIFACLDPFSGTIKDVDL